MNRNSVRARVVDICNIRRPELDGHSLRARCHTPHAAPAVLRVEPGEEADVSLDVVVLPAAERIVSDGEDVTGWTLACHDTILQRRWARRVDCRRALFRACGGMSVRGDVTRSGCTIVRPLVARSSQDPR